MNFYASREYLDAIAEIYFSGRRTSIEDVRIGRDILRLLVVDKNKVITNAQFLDYHEPLRESEYAHVEREFGFAERVVRRIVTLAEWERGGFEGFQLAPFVDWSRFETYADYHAFLLNRNRRHIRECERRRRRLEEAFGKLVFQMDDHRQDVLEAARLWKMRQLHRSGLKNWFADPRTDELLDLLRGRRLLIASTLRAGGRLLSVSVGFVYDRVWSGWIFTYDPEFSKYSAGHQLLHAMLAESFRLGHRELDFSIGSEDYKMIYATHGRLLGSIGHPPLLKQAATFAKKEARKNIPKLYAIASSLKRELNRKSFKTSEISAGNRRPAHSDKSRHGGTGGKSYSG